MPVNRRTRSLAALFATLGLTAAAFLAPATAAYVGPGLDWTETASTQRVVVLLPRQSAPELSLGDRLAPSVPR